MSETWDAAKLRSYIEAEWDRDAPAVIQQLNGWLARGGGVAVYRNQDLGHPDVGMPRLASYGSADAQLEASEPPGQLPDIGGYVNWRYQLTATYRGDPL